MSSKIYTITFIIATVITALCGCTDELDYLENNTRPTDVVCFTTSLSRKASDKATRSSYDILTIDEEKWDLTPLGSDAVTRGMPMTLLNGSAGVLAYIYDEWSNTTLPYSEIYDKEYLFDGDEMTAASNDIRWSNIAKVANNDSIAFYVYAPYQANGCTLSSNDTGGVPTLTYQVSNEIEKQEDLIVASWKGAKGVNYGTGIESRSVPLAFEHILTAVKFKVGFACTAKSLKVVGVNNSGVYRMGDKWNVNTAQTQDYIINFGTDGEGVDFNANDILTEDTTTLMMIPQTLPEGAQVVFTYIADGVAHTDTVLLKGQWNEGKMITYTLHNSTPPSNIYFDLAAGKVEIGPTTNNVSKGVTYSGKIYVNGNAVEVSGTHKKGNVYYVYQSSTSDSRYNASATGYATIEDFNNKVNCRIPDYKPVEYNNQRWSDFITNYTNVDSVIMVWYENNSTQTAAKVGRSGTKNNITVEAVANETYNLTIDDIYSTYQVASTSRLVGGITFSPGTKSNCILRINSVGDNRLGNIHYYNNNNNGSKLIFEGTGSLTVADVINTKGKAPGLSASESSGFFANYYCAAIGGNDDSTHERCYGIVINSGVIFAGSTVHENCSAIGGGGNGLGEVTINGGTVTAVASTTGTAIGGGIGYSSMGGEGLVYINGGNVYAYNLNNKRNIPSSAIGGAGSSASTGTRGTIEINGGYVYAYSALGTAIGGGSSQTKVGGDAYVTITGGQVIAKSGRGAGIGGGSACTGGGTGELDGGTAIINISGNPIIRTGSIGGGNTNASAGKIGSANINISGGDIQAQFVMAAGAKTTPSFTMTGGTIRNSSVDDEEYIHIKKKGGAVYLEDGHFTMSDGIIKDCSAEQGGAVYIERKSTDPMDEDEFNFIMSGGEIRSCYATGGTTEAGHGGALYLNSGQVKMTGGRMHYNYSENGNGGAIYIRNGNFFMEDGMPVITKNSAQKGDGGAVFVTSLINDENETVKVNLQRGKILENTANNYGGGVCVDMEGNATKADVVIGVTGQGVTEDDADPMITKNISLLQGGGLYVRGMNASITINSGMIDKNIVSAHVKNENVAISQDGGIVTLNDGLVTHQVVTFNSNFGAEPEEYTQNIVTNTNSRLTPNRFTRGGYRFNGWNTRPDGLGTDYSNEHLMDISEDITLYAKWQAQ